MEDYAPLLKEYGITGLLTLALLWFMRHIVLVVMPAKDRAHAKIEGDQRGVYLKALERIQDTFSGALTRIEDRFERVATRLDSRIESLAVEVKGLRAELRPRGAASGDQGIVDLAAAARRTQPPEGR